MCDNNGDTFIATLHNVILAPDLCDRLFFTVTLVNLVRLVCFSRFFYGVLWFTKRTIWLPCHIVHRGNMHFWGK